MITRSPQTPTTKTILIVEDDAIARAGLSSILNQVDYHAVPVANGQEAMDCLQAGLAPDLILLDMILPVFDGWKFLEQRQKHRTLSRIPVVVMTGLGIASEEWASSLGAVAFLRKPIDVAFLLDTVRRCPPSERASTNLA